MPINVMPHLLPTRGNRDNGGDMTMPDDRVNQIPILVLRARIQPTLQGLAYRARDREPVFEADTI